MWSGYHALISIIQRRLTPSTYTFEVKMGYLRRQTCFARFHDEHPSDYSDFIRLLACFYKKTRGRTRDFIERMQWGVSQVETVDASAFRAADSESASTIEILRSKHLPGIGCSPRSSSTIHSFHTSKHKNGTFLTGQRTIICIKVRW